MNTFYALSTGIALGLAFFHPFPALAIIALVTYGSFINDH